MTVLLKKTTLFEALGKNLTTSQTNIKVAALAKNIPKQSRMEDFQEYIVDWNLHRQHAGSFLFSPIF